jgi:hypothetical protein
MRINATSIAGFPRDSEPTLPAERTFDLGLSANRNVLHDSRHHARQEQ